MRSGGKGAALTVLGAADEAPAVALVELRVADEPEGAVADAVCAVVERAPHVGTALRAPLVVARVAVVVVVVLFWLGGC